MRKCKKKPKRDQSTASHFSPRAARFTLFSRTTCGWKIDGFEKFLRTVRLRASLRIWSRRRAFRPPETKGWVTHETPHHTSKFAEGRVRFAGSPHADERRGHRVFAG